MDKEQIRNSIKTSIDINRQYTDIIHSYINQGWYFVDSVSGKIVLSNTSADEGVAVCKYYTSDYLTIAVSPVRFNVPTRFSGTRLSSVIYSDILKQYQYYKLSDRTYTDNIDVYNYCHSVTMKRYGDRHDYCTKIREQFGNQNKITITSFSEKTIREKILPMIHSHRGFKSVKVKNIQEIFRVSGSNTMYYVAIFTVNTRCSRPYLEFKTFVKKKIEITDDLF